MDTTKRTPKVELNITCPHCRHRHPASRTCHEARMHAALVAARRNDALQAFDMRHSDTSLAERTEAELCAELVRLRREYQERAKSILKALEPERREAMADLFSGMDRN